MVLEDNVEKIGENDLNREFPFVVVLLLSIMASCLVTSLVNALVNSSSGPVIALATFLFSWVGILAISSMLIYRD